MKLFHTTQLQNPDYLHHLHYQKLLTKAGYGEITTEIKPLDVFYPAETYHQDYLKKNPLGYCPNHATGVKFDSEKTIVDVKCQKMVANEILKSLLYPSLGTKGQIEEDQPLKPHFIF